MGYALIPGSFNGVISKEELKKKTIEIRHDWIKRAIAAAKIDAGEIAKIPSVNSLKLVNSKVLKSFGNDSYTKTKRFFDVSSKTQGNHVILSALADASGKSMGFYRQSVLHKSGILREVRESDILETYKRSQFYKSGFPLNIVEIADEYNMADPRLSLGEKLKKTAYERLGFAKNQIQAVYIRLTPKELNLAEKMGRSEDIRLFSFLPEFAQKYLKSAQALEEAGHIISPVKAKWFLSGWGSAGMKFKSLALIGLGTALVAGAAYAMKPRANMT